MKTGTSLGLMAVGAILAFAIPRSPAFLNFQVVGWVLMATGTLGAIVPRRGYGWLRRRLVVKAAQDESVDPTEVKPRGRRFRRPLKPAGVISGRLGFVEPIGQVERETIEEYVEE